MVICTYPQLIAAYHVLHRLREPRHPPCALDYFRLMNSGIDVFQEYFALRRTIRYLLILSAVDYFYLNLQSCLCQYVKDLFPPRISADWLRRSAFSRKSGE